jgi:hypothetical protein
MRRETLGGEWWLLTANDQQDSEIPAWSAEPHAVVGI